MKPSNNANIENIPSEPAGLRILRILTVLMTIVMICGFVLIVSLLSIAIRKNTTDPNILKVHEFEIARDELLSSITYSSEYTILVFLDKNSSQVLRIISNKTGKILSDTLISSLIKEDSEK